MCICYLAFCHDFTTWAGQAWIMVGGERGLGFRVVYMYIYIYIRGSLVAYAHLIMNTHLKKS